MAPRRDICRFYRELYNRVTNSPAHWRNSAEQLLIASEVLVEAWHKAEQQVQECWKKGGLLGCAVPPESTTIFAALMLRGYAVECFMKALACCKGMKLARDGKYVGYKGHRLHEWAEKIEDLAPSETLFDEDQREVLKRLSTYIESLGRYHVPLDAEEFRQQQSANWPPQYENTFKEITSVLQAELDQFGITMQD